MIAVRMIFERRDPQLMQLGQSTKSAFPGFHEGIYISGSVERLILRVWSNKLKVIENWEHKFSLALERTDLVLLVKESDHSNWKDEFLWSEASLCVRFSPAGSQRRGYRGVASKWTQLTAFTVASKYTATTYHTFNSRSFTSSVRFPHRSHRYWW